MGTNIIWNLLLNLFPRKIRLTAENEVIITYY